MVLRPDELQPHTSCTQYAVRGPWPLAALQVSGKEDLPDYQALMQMIYGAELPLIAGQIDVQLHLLLFRG